MPRAPTFVAAAIMLLDPATGVFTTRSEPAYPQRIRASGNRTRLAYTNSGGSFGTIYDVATNTFTTKTLGTNGWENLALNHDGSRLVLDGTHLYDGSLNPLGTIAGPWLSTGAINASGTLVYRPRGRTLQRVSTTDLEVIGNYDLVDLTYDNVGQVVLSADGSRAVVITEHGVAVIDL